MHAVIETGGKQYRITNGDVVKIEKIVGEAGDKIKLEKVLYASDGKTIKIGSPLVAKAVVNAEILEQAKADKILVFKKKRRHNYRRTQGHRQQQTVIRITDITIDGKKVTVAKTAAKTATKTAKPAETKTVKKETAAKTPATAKKSESTKKPTATKKVAATKKINKII